MRAPISLKTLYLSYVGSITIHCITRYLTFTFPMHDTASTYLGKVHVNIIILLPRLPSMVGGMLPPSMTTVNSYIQKKSLSPSLSSANIR